MRSSRTLAIAAGLVFLAGRLAVFAENADPCRADAEKFCKDVQGKYHMACLKQHKAELSKACKAKMVQVKEQAAGNNPCLTDGHKLCPGMHPGDGKFMPCIKQHEAELSKACKAKIVQEKEQADKNNPCLADGQKLCPGMHPGDGKFMPCIQQHKAELSEACKVKLSEQREGKPEGDKGNPAGAPKPRLKQRLQRLLKPDAPARPI